jgi:hypothetical protein
VNGLVSNIALIIAKAPDSKLAFNPLLCADTIEVAFPTITTARRANIEFFGAYWHQL